MPNKYFVLRTCLIFVWGVLLIFLCGCKTGRDAGKSTQGVQSSNQGRSITAKKMRTQAVSRRIGRWAVVVGISDYKYDTDWNKAKGFFVPRLRLGT